MADEKVDVAVLRGQHEFPIAIARKETSAAALSRVVTNLKQIGGFGFSLTPKSEQAAVLRQLADAIEAGRRADTVSHIRRDDRDQ